MLRKTIPDWGIRSRLLPAPDYDIGELAARLGYSSLLRRSGRVVYWDTFTQLSAWIVTAGAVYSTYCYAPPSCMQLTPVGPGNVATALKWFPVFQSHQYGVEFYFSDAATDELEMVLSFNAGGQTLNGSLYFNFASGLLEYKAWGVGVRTTVLTLYPVAASYWFNFKVIIDYALQRITKIYYNDIELVTSLALGVMGVGANNQIGIEFKSKDNPPNGYILLDLFTLTIDER